MINQAIKFDLFDSLENTEFREFIGNFIRLDDSHRRQIYDLTFAVALVQDLNDNDEVVIHPSQTLKSAPSATKMIQVDNSIEPIKIRVNHRRFYCECGCDDFFRNIDENVVVCKACNISYNL